MILIQRLINYLNFKFNSRKFDTNLITGTDLRVSNYFKNLIIDL